MTNPLSPAMAVDVAQAAYATLGVRNTQAALIAAAPSGLQFDVDSATILRGRSSGVSLRGILSARSRPWRASRRFPGTTL